MTAATDGGFWGRAAARLLARAKRAEQEAADLRATVVAALPEYRAALDVGWNEGATPAPQDSPEFCALCAAVGVPVRP